MNLKLCLADFVHVIQKPSRGHYNSCTFVTQVYTVTPQLLNQIKYPPDRTFDLPFLFRYKCITSTKNVPSPALNES